MQLRALEGDDFDEVYRAFLEAFSDYVVPLQPSREQLAEMLTRRGWSPELSVAAIDEDRMVAFTLNGVDGRMAYDSGTGVIPSHRRRGLGRGMIDFLLPRLREAGCSEWILEVIDSNRPAVELYRSNGFAITRPLQSWTLASEFRGGPEPLVIPNPAPLIPKGESFHDVVPAWQNSTASILRSRDRYEVFGFLEEGGLIAYGIVYPSNGDVPQLAVRRDRRRRGLGRALLHAAAARSGKPLRLINVDARDQGIATFLERCGANPLIGQLEMVRSHITA